MVCLAAQVIGDVRNRIAASAGQRSGAAHTGSALRNAGVHEVPETFVLHRFDTVDFVGNGVVLVTQAVGQCERRQDLERVAEVELRLVVLVLGLQTGSLRRDSACSIVVPGGTRRSEAAKTKDQ